MAKVTVHSLAEEIYDALEQRKTHDDTERWFLKEGSPEWMKEVILDAGLKVNTDLDNTYEMAMRVLGAFADVADDDSDEDDYREAIYEIESDVYTSELTGWLHSNNNHVYYLDEVMGEFGDSLDGFQLLSIAQKLQIEEFGNLILTDLLERAEEANEDVEDEDDEDDEGETEE